MRSPDTVVRPDNTARKYRNSAFPSSFTYEIAWSANSCSRLPHYAAEILRPSTPDYLEYLQLGRRLQRSANPVQLRRELGENPAISEAAYQNCIRTVTAYMPHVRSPPSSFWLLGFKFSPRCPVLLEIRAYWISPVRLVGQYAVGDVETGMLSSGGTSSM